MTGDRLYHLSGRLTSPNITSQPTMAGILEYWSTGGLEYWLDCWLDCWLKYEPNRSESLIPWLTESRQHEMPPHIKSIYFGCCKMSGAVPDSVSDKCPCLLVVCLSKY